MPSTHLSGPLFYVGLATSSGPFYFGSKFLGRETLSAFLTQFGLPTVKNPADNATMYTAYALSGWRNIAVGASLLAFTLLRDRRGLGIMQMAMSFFVWMDGFEVWRTGAPFDVVVGGLIPATIFTTVALTTLLWGPGAPFRI